MNNPGSVIEKMRATWILLSGALFPCSAWSVWMSKISPELALYKFISSACKSIREKKVPIPQLHLFTKPIFAFLQDKPSFTKITHTYI